MWILYFHHNSGLAVTLLPPAPSGFCRKIQQPTYLIDKVRIFNLTNGGNLYVILLVEEGTDK